MLLSDEQALEAFENSNPQTDKESLATIATSLKELRENPTLALIRPYTKALVDTQIRMALGDGVQVFKRVRTPAGRWGMFQLTSDPREIEDALNRDFYDTGIEYKIVERGGNIRAIDSLLDRAYGKAKQFVEAKIDVENTIIREIQYIIPSQAEAPMIDMTEEAIVVEEEGEDNFSL